MVHFKKKKSYNIYISAVLNPPTCGNVLWQPQETETTTELF